MDIALSDAILSNNEAVVEDFIKKVKESERQKNEAFLFAVHHKRTKLAKKFMALDLDLTYEKDGWTALGKASANGNLELVNELLSVGANINHQSSKGWTALMVAACNKQEKLADFLIDNGANVNLCDLNGKTAMICAAYYGSLAIAERLIEKGADLLKKDNQGRDAYTIAMQQGHKEIAKAIKLSFKKKIKEIKRIVSPQRIQAQNNKENEG